MGTQISVNPARIAQHANEVKNTIRAELDKARTELNDKGTIEGGDFSITATPCALAYPMALQWAFEDLETHLKMLDDYASRLQTTSVNYAKAEAASTIKTV